MLQQPSVSSTSLRAKLGGGRSDTGVRRSMQADGADLNSTSTRFLFFSFSLMALSSDASMTFENHANDLQAQQVLFRVIQVFPEEGIPVLVQKMRLIRGLERTNIQWVQKVIAYCWNLTWRLARQVSIHRYRPDNVARWASFVDTIKDVDWLQVRYQATRRKSDSILSISSSLWTNPILTLQISVGAHMSGPKTSLWLC